METQNFNGKLIIALIMAGMIFAGTASATHTANVTLDKIFVKGGATATYTFNVSNNGPNDVFSIRIPVPTGFSGVSTSTIICPLDWLPNYIGQTVICGWSEGSLTNLTSGSSVNLSFSATAPTPDSDTQYPWNVTTLEKESSNASINSSTNTTVDVTGPATYSVAATNTSGWVKGTVTVTCSGATDTSSGVNASGYNYEYTLTDAGTGGWVPISGAGCTTSSCTWDTSVLNDSIVWIRCNATDDVSNTGNWSNASLNGIDNSAPVTNITVGTPKYINASDVYFVNSSTLFTLSATDGGGSGVNLTEYKNETGSWILYSGAFNASAIGGAGNHTIYYNSTDNVSNTETTKNISIYVDDAAPVIGTITITPFHTNGTNYTSGTSNITATVTDASGVSICTYALDDVTWVAANYTATSSTDGICTAIDIDTSVASLINMKATDNLTQVGNGSAIQVTPDITVPSVSVAGLLTWQNTNATAVLVCTDGGSGCNASSYGFNVSASNPGTCPAAKSAYTPSLVDSINVSSYQWVCAYAEDNVTNANVSSPAEFRVDEIAPTISDNYAYDNIWVNSNQSVTLTPLDSGDSLIKNVTWCNSTDTVCTPTTLLESPYQLNFSEGNTTVRYQTWDNAGSNSSIGSFVVLIDETAPVASVLGAPLSWNNTNATATANCSDSGSGCNESSYRLYVSTTEVVSCPTGVGSYTLASPQNISEHSWICSYVKDNVSNANFSTTATEFKVDEIKPACSVTGITALAGTDYTYVSGMTVYYNPSGVNNGTFKLTVGANDSVSGIANVSFPDTVSAGGNVSANQSGIYVKSYDWNNLSSYSSASTVTCYDIAGNTNTSTFTVTEDDTAPTISSVTLNQSRIKQGGSINVTSDGADAGAGIATCEAYLSTDDVYDEGVDVDLSDLGTDCNGSVTIPDSTPGLYYIIVRPVDHVGLANTSNLSVTVDNTPPAVSLTYSANPAKVVNVTITATYTEAVTSAPNITINQTGSIDITAPMINTSADNTTWAYNYTVYADNGSTYIDGVANVSLSSVSDAAGNPANDPTGANFTIDTIAPNVSLTYSANPVAAGTLTITATYTEAVTSAPNITINQTGLTDITAPMTNTSGNNKTWAYNYAVNAHDGSAYIDGVANVTLSSVNDSAGNAANTPTSANFTIDTTGPVAYSVAVTGVTAITGWLGGTVTVTCSVATDGSLGSGVNATGYNYQYTLDDAGTSGWTVISGTGCTTPSCSWNTAALNNSLAWIRCNATDNVSNTGNWSNASYAGIDNSAPVTNISVGDPNYYNDSVYFVNSSTLFTLSALDNASGVTLSGINLTQYNVNGTWVNYSAVPFNASSAGAGAHTISYRSIDNATNTETTKTLSIYVDDTDPTGSIIINDDLAYTSSVSVSLALTYADAGSGVDQVRYSNDGSTWSGWEAASATKAWTLTSGDGLKTVYYEVADNVGNVAQFTDTITLYTPATTTTLAPTTTTTTVTTTTLAGTTTTSTASTSSTTTGGSTTTTLPGTCVMPGNSAPCGTVTLAEVVAAITDWSEGSIPLGDIINLINSWADPTGYPPQ